MITTCPNCEIRYNIDPGLLAPNGRIVRCVRCAHTWTERPPGDVSASVGALPVPDVDGGIGASVFQETGRGGRWVAEAERGASGQIVGWAALAAVIVIVVGGAFFGRDWIVGDYYLTLGLLALATLFSIVIIRSPLGMAFRALRDGRTYAISRGISQFKYQLIVFASSAFFTGLAGGVYACHFKVMGASTLILHSCFFCFA